MSYFSASSALTSVALGMVLSSSGALTAGAKTSDEVTTFAYKQWQAQCGPEYCTLMPRAEPHFALMLGHRGGPWVMSFETEADATGTFLIDGQVVEWPAGQRIPFPQELLDGNTFEISFDAEGFSTGASLAGIKAALLWVEDQQPRPKMARMLEVRQPDWAALEAQATEITEQSCDIPMERRVEGVGPQMVPGHPEIRVLGQLCWMAAYNTGSKVYLLGPMVDDVAPVRPAARDQGAAVPEIGLYAITGDTMTSGGKGRGLGDCYTQETWRFDGFVYQLETRIVDDACDGKLIPRLVSPN